MRSSATSSARRTACRALLAAALLLLFGAAKYPPAPSGPALRTEASKLASAVTCPDGLARHRSRPVVLLVHGTATTAEETWPLGLGRSLPLAGFDWCMVQLPDRALTDIQVSNQYVFAPGRT